MSFGPPDDIWVVDQVIDDLQSVADAQAQPPLYAPLPRLGPVQNVQPPTRDVVDAFVLLHLYFEFGMSLPTAQQALPYQNANDRIGAFLYAIWPRLDPDSRHILQRLPALRHVIEYQWQQTPAGKRSQIAAFFSPIFAAYRRIIAGA